MIASSSKLILFLSYTYVGSVHDKKIADEAGIGFEKVIEVLQDSGFQGFSPKNAIIVQPVKKPKGKELTETQKQDNKQKSSERVVVEHAIGQVKVWRILKDKIRSWRSEIRDQVMMIGCGLNNFKLKLKGINLYST